jgi:hypothetical protein
MKYLVKVPPTKEQGNYKTTAQSGWGETYRKNALWSYNSAREHDGLPPIKRMPKGTTYEKINQL